MTQNKPNYVAVDKDGRKYMTVKATGKKLYIKEKPEPVLPRKRGMKWV